MSSSRKMRAGRARGVLLLLVAVSSSGAAGASYHAEIRRDSYGVPHILADGYSDAGFGYGYAVAEDSACMMAERWLTVSARRARYLGAGNRDANVASDFFWRYLLDQDPVGKARKSHGADAPLPEVEELVQGFAAGYNRYLASIHYRPADPACAKADWIRPITARDVYYQTLYVSGLLAFFGDYWGKYPAVVAARPPAEPARDSAGLRSWGWAGDTPTTLPGSNMVGLGAEASADGRTLFFTNPHWEWYGPNRFYEAHLTIPGKLNVYGAGFIGLPVLNFAHNEHLAWSHTVSTPRVAQIYRLDLAGSPTVYRVDGRRVPMRAVPVSIAVRGEHGLARRSHTFWQTRFGLVLEDATHRWNAEHAYTILSKDLNVRLLNQDFLYANAQNVREIHAAAGRTLGWGWFNTAAGDDHGDVLFGALQSVPKLSDAQLERCALPEDPAGAVLAGTRADCLPGSDPKAPVTGIYPIDELPREFRRDYVANSNDSHWDVNDRAKLEGYPRIMGEERTPRSLRTRIGLKQIEERLAGTDGYPGRGFTFEQLVAITTDNHVLAGELWRAPLVALCRATPALAAQPENCEALAHWGLSFELDDPGAVLFRVFCEHLGLGGFAPAAADLFTTPFDPSDAIHTPRGLDVSNPRVVKALVDAVADLRASGVAPDAALRRYQVALKGAERIPIPGGPGGMGVYNFIGPAPDWQVGSGWRGVVNGSTYISWLHFTADGPVGRVIMSHSESSDPTSPHSADQTRLFSAKEFRPLLFRESEVRSDPHVLIENIHQ